MIKKLTLILASIILHHHIIAQNRTESFKLANPETKVRRSLYSSIDFQDVRRYTSALGLSSLELSMLGQM